MALGHLLNLTNSPLPPFAFSVGSLENQGAAFRQLPRLASWSHFCTQGFCTHIYGLEQSHDWGAYWGHDWGDDFHPAKFRRIINLNLSLEDSALNMLKLVFP
jgi:hypothetical protein